VVVVVGDGSLRRHLERRLPWVRFLGFRDGQELSEVFASLDVFVHTGADETFCQAAQEALASGVPVAAPAAGPACPPPRVYLVTVPRSVVQLARRELAGLGMLAGLRLGADADTLGTPDDRLTTTVDVRPWLDRKWAAMRAHASQLGPGSPLDDLPEPLRAALLGTEWFVRRR
jgi:LmbE family N-acetylglucosaminyl deacetylase